MGSKVLWNLALRCTGTVKIDRAHRALSPPKKNYHQLVVVKLHNFIDKQHIFATAREKGELIYQGSKIHICHDFLSENGLI